jgi:hypothetical protein
MSADVARMPGRRDRVRGLPDSDATAPIAEPAAAPVAEPFAESLAEEPATAAEPAASASEGSGQGEGDRSARQGDGDARSAGYRGAPRSPRTLRLYDPLYARIGALVRALEDEGELTDRTELIQALLHFELPEDAASARELLRRWRRFLAG